MALSEFTIHYRSRCLSLPEKKTEHCASVITGILKILESSLINLKHGINVDIAKDSPSWPFLACKLSVLCATYRFRNVMVWSEFDALQWHHMNTVASQITGNSTVSSNVCLCAHQKENIKPPHHWPLWGKSIGHLWIPLTKGQKRGKYLHFVPSS